MITVDRIADIEQDIRQHVQRQALVISSDDMIIFRTLCDRLYSLRLEMRADDKVNVG